MRACLGFLDRVGGVLVAPRATLAREMADKAPHGLGDVAWLLLLRVLAGETPRLARAVSLGVDHGVVFGVQAVLAVFQQVLPDVAGILVGALVMSLFAGRRARPRGHSLDLAAYAFVPYLATEVLAALLFTLRGYEPSLAKQQGVQAAALAWAAFVWTQGLKASRDAVERDSSDGGPA